MQSLFCKYTANNLLKSNNASLYTWCRMLFGSKDYGDRLFYQAAVHGTLRLHCPLGHVCFHTPYCLQSLDVPSSFSVPNANLKARPRFLFNCFQFLRKLGKYFLTKVELHHCGLLLTCTIICSVHYINVTIF